MVKAQSSEHR